MADIIGAANNRSPNDINVIGDRYYDNSIQKLNFANLYGKCVQIGKAYIFQGRINVSKEGDFKKNLVKNYEILKLKKVKIAKRYDNIIAVTSISPKHNNFNQQHEAVATWSKYFKVYSLNCEEEIKVLKRKFPTVEFIPVKTTMKEFTGKPLVRINDMLDLGKELDKDVLLINSDIILTDFPQPKEGIGIITRYNFKDDLTIAKEFRWGFDAFIIPNKHLNIFPPSMFALGACWHDFFYPYTAITKKVKVYFVTEKIAYHKDHPVQYHPNEWKKFGEYFRFHFNLESFTNIGEMCTWVYDCIKKKGIKKEKIKVQITSHIPNNKLTLEKIKQLLPDLEIEQL